MLAILSLLVGCRADGTSVKTGDTENPDAEPDADGDGFSGEDCDDDDAAVFPGAGEICNGLDDDCDGSVDEDLRTTAWADTDGDGFGDPGAAEEVCEISAGFVGNAEDCDDSEPAISPAGVEVCNEADDNCDGVIDEGVQNTFYADADADGFGDPAGGIGACEVPEGYVQNDGDCDDKTAAASPARDEECDEIDNDCDGEVDEGVLRFWTVDLDADGFGSGGEQAACAQPTGYAADDGDCDDADPEVFPGAEETCNDVDDDCDTVVDDGIDTDGDGVADCFDAEVCDGLDNDGDGAVDEADSVDAPTWAIDYDADGYGSGRYTVTQCEAPAGYVADASDCDDTDADVHPGASETCDGSDEDCDGTADDGVTVYDWYDDADGDGYGDPARHVSDCVSPSGYVADDGDCDDTDSGVNPAASETCDGVDENCDGSVDEGLAVSSWYADADGDGVGDTSTYVSDCVAPPGFAATGGDCDDTDASVQVCASCLDVLNAGTSIGDGIYTIDPCGTGAADFWCDMTTDGGGWTLAGVMAADSTEPLGVSDWGTVGTTPYSSNLACVEYSEFMVFNETYADWYKDSYTPGSFSATAGEFTVGATTDAFVQGWYGPVSSPYTMACVNLNATYGAPYFGCDNDWTGGQLGHVTEYAGEYCSGGRLDGSWAWSVGSSCMYRGVMYDWGWAIR